MDYLPLVSFIEVNTYLTCKEIKMKMVTKFNFKFSNDLQVLQITWYYKIEGYFT